MNSTLIRFRDFLETYGRDTWVRPSQMVGKLVRGDRSKSVHFGVGPRVAML